MAAARLLFLVVLVFVGTVEAFLGQPFGTPCTFRRSRVTGASASFRPLINNLGVENRAHQWKMCGSRSGGGEGPIGGEDDSEAVKAFRLKKLLKKSSVFLIGMDGSGKNEIGQELASAIGSGPHSKNISSILFHVEKSRGLESAAQQLLSPATASQNSSSFD